MKKKIKDLTREEKRQFCKKYDCHFCPLHFYVGISLGCFEHLDYKMEEEVDVEEN